MQYNILVAALIISVILNMFMVIYFSFIEYEYRKIIETARKIINKKHMIICELKHILKVLKGDRNATRK